MPVQLINEKRIDDDMRSSYQIINKNTAGVKVLGMF